MKVIKKKTAVKILKYFVNCVILVLISGVFLFLNSLTKPVDNIIYLNWEEASVTYADGTETSFDPADFSEQPDTSSTYRFKTTLSGSYGYGDLIFETYGLDITLSLNDNILYSSSGSLTDPQAISTQAHISLLDGSTGELVMVCKVTDPDYVMFPPMLRFTELSAASTADYAYANMYGIPAGLLSAAIILISLLLAFSVTHARTNWSLIPLLLAAICLILNHTVTGLGYYFFPENINSIFAWNGFTYLIPALLIIYIIMNTRRGFWKSFGITALATFCILAICLITSRVSGGYLYNYVTSELKLLTETGQCNTLFYWITVWLTLACTIISAYSAASSYIKQKNERQALSMKNELILKNYEAIEQRMKLSAKLRHEFTHDLTAMATLCAKGDYDALSDMISDLKGQNTELAQPVFSANFAVNSILLDASSRAETLGIDFQGHANVSPDINIEEKDLCELLMNMLSNAIEAADQVSSDKSRFVKFRIEERNGFLAIKCENTYDTEPVYDTHSRLISTKSDSDMHGFGITVMAEIAQKYNSLLDISLSDDRIFTVQTALQLKINNA